MNKTFTTGCAFALSLGVAEIAQANKTKCNAGFVAGVLQRGAVDKEKFVVSERNYRLEVNDNVVPYHMAPMTQAVLNAATPEILEATWVPADNLAEEVCEIKVKHANGQETKVVLYPYTYTCKQ